MNFCCKKISEEDTNDDGYNDLLNLNIFINGIPANDIKAAKLLLLFNCSLTVSFVFRIVKMIFK